MSGQSSDAAAAGERASFSPPPITTIADCGLSTVLTQRYEAAGITRLFGWQAEALSQPGVLEGKRHLLYTASTSAGKTLVAELLLLRQLESHGQRAKALVILPLRALVAQKAAELTKLLEKTGLTVAPYMTAVGELPMPRRLNIAVCTFEKASMVVQSMAEHGRLGEVVAVVIDELHLLGGDERGANLERTIARLLLHARRPASRAVRPAAATAAAEAYAATEPPSTADKAGGELDGGAHGGGGGSSSALSAPGRGSEAARAGLERRGVQIIGMSATLPNIHELVGWLGLDARGLCACHVADATKREVPLHEMLVSCSVSTCDPSDLRVLNLAGVPVESPPPWALPPSTLQAAPPASSAAFSALPKERKLDVAIRIARPTCRAEQGVLVFCQTKRECEAYAKHAASALDAEGRSVVPRDEARAEEVPEHLSLEELP